MLIYLLFFLVNLDQIWQPILANDEIINDSSQECDRLINDNVNQNENEQDNFDFDDIKPSKSNVASLGTSLSTSLPNEYKYMRKSSFSSTNTDSSNIKHKHETDDEFIEEFYILPSPTDDIDEIMANTSNSIKVRNTRSLRSEKNQIPPGSIVRSTLLENITPPIHSYKNSYKRSGKSEKNIFTAYDYDSKFTDSDILSFRKLLNVSMKQYNIDLPLCQDCGLAVYNHILDEIKEIDNDIDVYTKFLNEDSTVELENDIKILNQQSRMTQATLNHYQSLLNETLEARKRLHDDIVNLLEKEEKLHILEEKFLYRYNEKKIEAYKLHDEIVSIQNQLECSDNKLNMLRCSNSLNDTFHIWMDGHFGKINNLRFGIRCYGNIYESSSIEVSSALGFATLLICRLSDRLNVPFNSIRFLGSLSSIKADSGSEYYPLHMENIEKSFIPSGKVKKFDEGIILLIKHVYKLYEVIRSKDPNFKLPFPLTKEGLIGNYEPRRKLISEENWTHAMKQFLIDLKKILDWTILNEQ